VSADGSSERRSPRQTRARATVDAIVEAAGRLLVEGGLAGVTTNAVAGRAGVSIGSLYQYFPNKEALLWAVQRRHRQQVMPLVDHALERLADPALDLVEGILTFMRGLVALHDSDPAGNRALVRELDEQPRAEDLHAFTAHATRLLAARRRCPEADVRPTAWLLALSLTHVGRALVHDPPDLDRERVFRDLGGMLEGLLREPGARARQGEP
jgi:AcrR family transcriptional regulator